MERRQLFHIGFQETEHEISRADYMLSHCKSNAFSSGEDTSPTVWGKQSSWGRTRLRCSTTLRRRLLA